jgi:hypothetical protein
MKPRCVLSILFFLLLLFVVNALSSQNALANQSNQVNRANYVTQDNQAAPPDNNNGNKWDKNHPMFNKREHDEMQTFWESHHEHPPAGLRDEDRLPANWQAQLKPGFVLTADWNHKLHAPPPQLGFHLRRPPIPNIVYLIGGYVVLVNHHDWHVDDVVDLNSASKP